MIQQPYIIQRFSLEGTLLLKTEENKFRFDNCGAYAYIAYYPNEHTEKLVRKFKTALENQYGKVMSINADFHHEIFPGQDIPQNIRDEIKAYIQTSFAVIHIPMNVKLYQYIYDTPIPTLEMVIFIPKNHEQYFTTRSVYWDYQEAHDLKEWNQIVNEVAELHGQCIPTEKWLTEENGN